LNSSAYLIFYILFDASYVCLLGNKIFVSSLLPKKSTLKPGNTLSRTDKRFGTERKLECLQTKTAVDNHAFKLLTTDTAETDLKENFPLIETNWVFILHLLFPWKQ
jgi:hypothetical protein